MPGAGNDDLFGGTGSDSLTGGTGTDRFRFDTALSATTNVDHILDFAVVDDTIFLDRNIFTGIAVNGTLAAGAFRAGTAAGDADDRIVYDAATGNIFYDADGLGGSRPDPVRHRHRRNRAHQCRLQRLHLRGQAGRAIASLRPEGSFGRLAGPCLSSI